MQLVPTMRAPGIAAGLDRDFVWRYRLVTVLLYLGALQVADYERQRLRRMSWI
jgi:hypothetical protein